MSETAGLSNWHLGEVARLGNTGNRFNYNEFLSLLLPRVSL